MALLDKDGNIVSSIADSIGVEADDLPEMQQAYEAIPSPGQVIVLRKTVEKFLRNKDGSVMRGTKNRPIEKPLGQVQDEERANVVAIVARVGEDVGEGPLQSVWFEKGDQVVIAPHVFTEVQLSGTESVWVGPFAGVKMVLRPTIVADQKADA